VTHCRGQQQTPWTMLARFGYEDRFFTLEIPCEIEDEPELAVGETFELSRSAFEFLENLAQNASSRRSQGEGSETSQPQMKNSRGVSATGRGRDRMEVGGSITWGDLGDILCVVPTVSHPWSYPPICPVSKATSAVCFTVCSQPCGVL
jgi:hypothetical protein